MPKTAKGIIYLIIEKKEIKDFFVLGRKRTTNFFIINIKIYFENFQ